LTTKDIVSRIFILAPVANDSSGSSSATAYLTPEVVARKNLTVAVKCLVTRLIFDTGAVSKESSGAEPQVVGVEITSSTSKKPGSRYIVRCNKEVILSAGAIATPQLLLLSGIGPRKDLEDLDIAITLENQHVGRNLMDVSSPILVQTVVHYDE
jgi:choline dehydrogenase